MPSLVAGHCDYPARGKNSVRRGVLSECRAAYVRYRFDNRLMYAGCVSVGQIQLPARLQIPANTFGSGI